jgi:hypothetical protein
MRLNIDGAGENRRETSKKGVPRAAWLGDMWRFEIAALMFLYDYNWQVFFRIGE